MTLTKRAKKLSYGRIGYVKCPTCGTKNITKWIPNRVQSKYRFVTCINCGEGYHQLIEYTLKLNINNNIEEEAEHE